MVLIHSQNKIYYSRHQSVTSHMHAELNICSRDLDDLKTKYQDKTIHITYHYCATEYGYYIMFTDTVKNNKYIY